MQDAQEVSVFLERVPGEQVHEWQWMQFISSTARSQTWLRESLCYGVLLPELLPTRAEGFSCWNCPAIVSRNQVSHSRGKDISHSLGRAHKLKGEQRPGSKENTGGGWIYKMIARHGSKWEQMGAQTQTYEASTWSIFYLNLGQTWPVDCSSQLLVSNEPKI